MSGMRKLHSGMTLVESLIALAILGIVMSLAYGAITSSLRVQGQQEAITTNQAKLRRIIEVISQDLRSAVFGSITDNPYESNSKQVSFMMLTGGAGYPVIQKSGFSGSNSFEAIISDGDDMVGQQVVLVNSDGLGVVVPVTGASSPSGGTVEFFSSCRNTIPYGTSVLMFQVETTGIRYDQDSTNMMLRTANVDEQPFAFELADLRFDYVYTYTSPEAGVTGTPVNTVIVESEPRRGSHGLPVRTFSQAGYVFTLTRLQVIVESRAEVNGIESDFAYSGQVDLSRAAHFKVEEIVPCS